MKNLTSSELWQFARARHTWLIPSVLILVLAVVFPLVYLSATTSPEENLHDLPVALVTEVQGGSSDATFSEDVTAAVADGVDHTKISLITMTSDELSTAMDEDSVAGAIIIPSDFDSSMESLLAGPDAATGLPQVHLVTNAADGGISSGLVTQNITPVLQAVNAALGQRLVAELDSSGQTVDAAHALLLSTPFTVSDAPYRDLPSNAGFGMSAFYYALALVLLGFVGASVINPSVDSALGFAPAEMGPLVARRPYRHTTRTQTLLVKWGLLLAIAPIASGLILGATSLAGVVSSHPVHLWLFGTAAIVAVGWGALALFAIFGGGIGALVNTTFFIALAMTSSGGTVPVEATPQFFVWMSWISPFHAVVEGARSLLYFQGNGAAGLADGWLRLGIGATAALALGLVVTIAYSRQRMFTRHPRPALATAPATTAR